MTNHEHCGNQWSLCCDIVERVKKQLDFTKQKVDGKMEDKIEQHDLLHILQKILGEKNGTKKKNHGNTR